MEDREFFDELYQLWTKTTGAENSFWMPVEDDYSAHSGNQYIKAVGDEFEKAVAWEVSEPDADFITAIHGCFGDLHRRLHAALDEADRADLDRDSRECRIYELESELEELKRRYVFPLQNVAYVHGKEAD